MERYLCSCGVLIKEFKHFAESVTAKVKAATYRIAAAAQRPVEYLSSPKLSKEAYARQIALQNGISQGLVALFSAKEPCYSYSVRGDRASKEIHLVIEPRMCTHFYHYFVHADFGLMHVRVQSWFPFTVEVCLNGREWEKLRVKSGQTFGWKLPSTTQDHSRFIAPLTKTLSRCLNGDLCALA